MREKIKVIGFGIGTSCKDYLSLYKDEYDIVALSDWDHKTHGTERYGYKIINPEDFGYWDYDKILILSTYVTEIKKQLKERLNISEDALIIPAKYKIKGKDLPFKDERTKTFARDLLIHLFHLSSVFELTLFTDFGTLLGLTRENDIMENDDDIDLSVNEKDREKIIRLIVFFVKNPIVSEGINWKCDVKKEPNGKIWALYLRFDNILENIFKSFTVSIGIRKFHEGHSFCMHFKTLACPEYHFNNYDTIEWNNVILKAPFNHKKYLDLLYGNWIVPQQFTLESKYGTSFKGNIQDVKVNLINEPFLI